MKPVTIKYRPISFIPAYRTVSGSFPQNWGEVSAKQLIAIACVYKNRISDLAFLIGNVSFAHADIETHRRLRTL